MNFGNWTVTNDSIEFDNGKNTYSIFPMPTLTHSIEISDGIEVFHWLHQVPDKTWMTKQDIRDLEAAFYHAANQQGLPIPAHVKSNTDKLVSDFINEKKQ